MEKLTGAKHNHLFTDLIKVFIFGLMLLLPFLCFLPTGFYYGFNEHATNTETTTINYKYQSNEVNTIDDLVEGNIYEINDFVIDTTLLNGSFNFQVIKCEHLIFDNASDSFDGTYVSDYNNKEFNYIYIELSTNDAYVYYSNENANVSVMYEFEYDFLRFGNCIFIFNDSLLSYLLNDSYLPQYTDYNVIESVSVNTDDTISNKMYLAWEDVWTSPLFNWTNTTPLNTGLNGFIGIFGINQSSYIANCLIYLLTITAIYVVFDIVLGMFKWLTHLINK